MKDQVPSGSSDAMQLHELAMQYMCVTTSIDVSQIIRDPDQLQLQDPVTHDLLQKWRELENEVNESTGKYYNIWYDQMSRHAEQILNQLDRVKQEHNRVEQVLDALQSYNREHLGS
jgi:hypothetical protein